MKWPYLMMTHLCPSMELNRNAPLCCTRGQHNTCDKPPWWVKDHHDERLSWLMKDHPDETVVINERPPQWKTVLINERPHWWKTTLMNEHPHEKPHWCKTTLMTDHFSLKSTMMKAFPSYMMMLAIHLQGTKPPSTACWLGMKYLFLHDDAGHPSAGHQASKHSMLVGNEISVLTWWC